jgi:hypothetical protein
MINKSGDVQIPTGAIHYIPADGFENQSRGNKTGEIGIFKWAVSNLSRPFIYSFFTRGHWDRKPYYFSNSILYMLIDGVWRPVNDKNVTETALHHCHLCRHSDYSRHIDSSHHEADGIVGRKCINSQD